MYNSLWVFIGSISKMRFKRVTVATTANLPPPMEENPHPADQLMDSLGFSNVENNLYLRRDTKDEREEKQEYEDNICIICFSNNINALIKPCNHGGFCRNCSIENFKHSAKCPLCRNEIDYIIIYEKRLDGNYYQIERYPQEVVGEDRIF